MWFILHEATPDGLTGLESLFDNARKLNVSQPREIPAGLLPQNQLQIASFAINFKLTLASLTPAHVLSPFLRLQKSNWLAAAVANLTRPRIVWFAQALF